MLDIIPEELDHLLERGWRRFGIAYFRPHCGPCSECVPLRVPIASFSMSRNQKRVWSRAKNVRMEISEPTIDEVRLQLYADWHCMQGEARGWAREGISEEEYYHQFAFPHPSVRELAYYDEEKLIAVSIVDETPKALSAVYTYHHPDYRKLSLGTASILWQMKLAKEMKKRWLYLGYRVLGCVSSEYKARFKPHELLIGWPALNERPSWLLQGGGDE